MSYRGLVLPPAAVTFVEKGGRDLPLALAGVTEPMEAGRPLRLVGPSGQSLGLALADPENERLRVMARADEAVDALGPAFFAARVERALALRRTLGLVGERSAFRLVHGAGDGLPGFAMDVLAPWAVLYVYSRAFVPHGQLLAQAAIDQAGLRGVVVKVRSRGAASQQRVKQEAVGEAPPETLVVEERGVPFEVHPDRGLNTGLFTDMREHRHGLARFVAGQAVLNGFAYTGTLSVVAARAGARSVTTVDLSSGVLGWARDNFRLSGLDPFATPFRFEANDVGRFLDDEARAEPALRRDPARPARLLGRARSDLRHRPRLPGPDRAGHPTAHRRRAPLARLQRAHEPPPGPRRGRLPTGPARRHAAGDGQPAPRPPDASPPSRKTATCRSASSGWSEPGAGSPVPSGEGRMIPGPCAQLSCSSLSPPSPSRLLAEEAAPAAVVPGRVTPLFNGKDLSGWEADVPARDTDKNAPASFVVRDGLLVSLGKPEGHLRDHDGLPGLPPRGRVPLPGQGRQLRRPRARLAPARPLQDVPAVDRGADEQRGRRRLLVHPGEHRGARHGEAPPAQGRREMGRRRGRRPPHPQPDRRLREAARAVEHHGHRGPRPERKVWVNGDLVNDGFTPRPTSGKIALQAEGTEVEFRKVEIGPLAPADEVAQIAGALTPCPRALACSR